MTGAHPAKQDAGGGDRPSGRPDPPCSLYLLTSLLTAEDLCKDIRSTNLSGPDSLLQCIGAGYIGRSGVHLYPFHIKIPGPTELQTPGYRPQCSSLLDTRVSRIGLFLGTRSHCGPTRQ